jgi:hypothetical protein
VTAPNAQTGWFQSAFLKSCQQGNHPVRAFGASTPPDSGGDTRPNTVYLFPRRNRDNVLKDFMESRPDTVEHILSQETLLDKVHQKAAELGVGSGIP